jgi:GT2 family glycosyltransferase
VLEDRLRKLFYSLWPKRPAACPAPAEGEPASQRVRLSIVLGSFNRRPFLEAAIESVRNNGIPCSYEIIVVDGGSTDGALEWLVSQRDIVTVVQHNRGEFRGVPVRRRSWGYFMNLGFKLAQGDWVLMISDDCVVLPGAIASSLREADRLQHMSRKVGGIAYYFRDWPQDSRYYVLETIGQKLMVNHGLFSRRALEAVNFADEHSYAFYKADGDLCLRIWEAGYEIVDCTDALVEHYVDPAELVRQSNNAILDADREAYARRWRHLVKKPGRRRECEKVDPAGTAERVFGPLHSAARGSS